MDRAVEVQQVKHLQGHTDPFLFGARMCHADLVRPSPFLLDGDECWSPFEDSRLISFVSTASIQALYTTVTLLNAIARKYGKRSVYSQVRTLSFASSRAE